MLSLNEKTILELQNLMDEGKLTSVELVSYYIERIAKYDKDGPKLNSVLELNPDVFFIAEAMDYERRTKGRRSLLHGIPVLIKDNIDTGDKMHTSAGSLALADSYASEDAFLVKKLREAGAVIMGKTNMTEFANFMTFNMPCGYSSRGGQVLNPYDPAKTPSGSSSGSAVAVASNFCSVAVGTETNGSIIGPARANCIEGIKPTVGLISRSGIIPISHSQDTAGPLARTVSDAAILLSAMMGADDSDPATLVSECIKPQQIIDAISDTDIRGLRIGVSITCYNEFTAEERQILDEAAGILEREGAAVIKLDNLKKEQSDDDSSVCLHEFKAGINYYLSRIRHPRIKTLADIIAFNRQNADRTLKYGQKLLELSEQTSGTLTESRYILDRMLDIELTRTKVLDRAMNEHKLDALVFLEDTSLAPISGYPAIIVPAGMINGTTYGMEFVGRRFSEPLLIKLAHVYEQATKRRFEPNF